MIIRRKQVIRRRKKVKMPQVDFDLEIVKEIKKQKDRSKEYDQGWYP